MPEGPEIRRAADRVARVLVGRVIEDIRFHLPDLAGYEKRLKGIVVDGVETRGKAMLTRFDNGMTLYSHNQLYGRWFTTKRPRMPRTKRQLRVEIHTATHSALLYSASDIEVLKADQLDQHPFLSRIGPDVMDRELQTSDLRRRLESPRFARRRIGTLFLDQAFLAGIGNYLRSEILFVSGLHPSHRPVDLGRNELEKLCGNAIRIARRSYRSGGITVPPGLELQLKREGLPFEERRFHVFGRVGQECRLCGSEIERLAAGGRNLFLCPRCQPERREESPHASNS